MLTKIRMENINSIKESVELNLSKGRYNFKGNMVLNNQSVNPIGIFGSNGSGKTVLLRAIHHLSKLMFEQSSELRAFLPYLPEIDKNSQLKLEFILDDDLYEYEIITTFTEIIKEELKVKDIYLIRTNDNYIVNKEEDEIKKGVIEGKLYSAIRQIGIEEYSIENPLFFVKKAYNFLSSITFIDVRGDVFGKVVSQKSIENIMVEKSDSVKDIIKEYNEFPTYSLKMSKTAENTHQLMFSFDDRHYLPKALMSNGMKAHSTILSTILSVPKGSLLIIDELERSLHPFVAKQFVETLNNKYNIQLMFTSHNTNLLQSLRPDQIFFSKWDTENKSSKYLKLSEIYPNIREVNNIEKMYYGGLLDE